MTGLSKCESANRYPVEISVCYVSRPNVSDQEVDIVERIQNLTAKLYVCALSYPRLFNYAHVGAEEVRSIEEQIGAKLTRGCRRGYVPAARGTGNQAERFQSVLNNVVRK